MKHQSNTPRPSESLVERRQFPRPCPDMLRDMAPCLAQLKRQLAERQSMA